MLLPARRTRRMMWTYRRRRTRTLIAIYVSMEPLLLLLLSEFVYERSCVYVDLCVIEQVVTLFVDLRDV